jgi:putative oxidoreductase
MPKRLLVDLICGSLILLYLYTALNKLFHYKPFRATLQASPLVGSWSGVVAWVVPLTEILLCLLLFFPATKRAGMYTSLLMLSFFTIYILYLLFFAPHLPCRCGGVIEHISWKQHVFFNLFFMGINIIGLRLDRKLKRGWEGPVPYPTRKDVI